MLIASVAFPVPLHKSFHYEVPAGMRVEIGTRVRASFGPRKLAGTVLEVSQGEPSRPLKRLDAVLDPPVPAELVRLAVWLAGRYACPVGECLRAAFPPEVASRRGPEPPAPASPAPLRGAAPSFELTAAQKAAVEGLAGRLGLAEPGEALLFGVPASGKTEVYLRLIRRALERPGSQVLFLLPEISLTQPFLAGFAASLGLPCALWHSRLGAPERRRIWRGLASGAIRLVVGARSAVLLPLPGLSLVVIDEEQDDSFKQEGRPPFYHAREAARFRARAARALLVLGSATPSVESLQRARGGGSALVVMPERVFPGAPPTVRVVSRPPARSTIGPELHESLRACLGRGDQAILLVHRRGYSTLLLCPRCGWIGRCATCGVALVRHRAASREFSLLCHQCGRQSPLPSRCPQGCPVPLRSLGTGTQRVVEDLKELAPEARVLRMDSDSLAEGDPRGERLLESFRARQADVLVGTKLVAKSFHFPDVTLVGVVDADTLLYMPDFRSAERTLQLLHQVGGRSGRERKAGEVLIQTLHPEHYAVAQAERRDWDSFVQEELRHRREWGYPPFSTLVRLLVSGAREAAVDQSAERLAQSLRSALASAAEVLGPAPALPAFSRGKHRRHLLLKLFDPARLEEACRLSLGCPLEAGVRLRPDVDPHALI